MTFASIAKNLASKGIATRMQDPQVMLADYKGYTLSFAVATDGNVHNVSCRNRSGQSLYFKSLKAAVAHCE